jgi:hypothetical protein
MPRQDAHVISQINAAISGESQVKLDSVPERCGGIQEQIKRFDREPNWVKAVIKPHDPRSEMATPGLMLPDHTRNYRKLSKNPISPPFPRLSPALFLLSPTHPMFSVCPLSLSDLTLPPTLCPLFEAASILNGRALRAHLRAVRLE